MCVCVCVCVYTKMLGLGFRLYVNILTNNIIFIKLILKQVLVVLTVVPTAPLAHIAWNKHLLTPSRTNFCKHMEC